MALKCFLVTVIMLLLSEGAPAALLLSDHNAPLCTGCNYNEVSEAQWHKLLYHLN